METLPPKCEGLQAGTEIINSKLHMKTPSMFWIGAVGIQHQRDHRLK